MKLSRKALLMVLVLGATALMSFAAAAPSAAQTGTFCSLIGQRTGGDILVDVPNSFADGLPGNAVQCRVLIRQESGTPIPAQRAINDYSAIAGIDVWTANRNADFDIYDPPVRVCFDASEFGVSAEDAVSPEDLAAGENGPALMYSDARYTFADRFSFRYNSFSRNFTQLNVVEAGIADGYICGDLSFPGTLNLVPGIPGIFSDDDPQHPNYAGDRPDRCLVPGSRDCFD